jgi:hypothetical protein
MADSAISQLILAGSGLAIDEFAIGEVGASKKITLSQIADFVNSSGMLVSLVDNISPYLSTAMVKISGIDVVIDAGTYIFEYYIRAQFAHVTQSIKFAVNHTGTTTSFPYFFQYPCAVSTTSSGSMSQSQNTPAGRVWCSHSTRTKNTTLGPGTNVDTINADILFKVFGMVIVTVTGTLELYFGCLNNTAGRSITIMTGTCLILKKVG